MIVGGRVSASNYFTAISAAFNSSTNGEDDVDDTFSFTAVEEINWNHE